MEETPKVKRVKSLAEERGRMEEERKQRRLLMLMAGAAGIAVAAGVLWLAARPFLARHGERKMASQQERIRALVEEGKTLFGQNRSEIVRRMGQPVRMEDEVMRGRRGRGGEPVIYRIFYDGLFLEVQRLHPPGEPDRETLSQVVITGLSYKLREELGVGAHRNRVRKVLGDPQVEEPGRDIYETADVFRQQVRFEYAGEYVSKIEWRF